MADANSKHLDGAGLSHLWSKLKAMLSGKVDAVEGKSLSSNDYTTAEKQKLSNIEAGANKYIHPSHNAYSSGLYKITVDSLGHVSNTTVVTKSDITALGIPSTNTTYGAATQSAPGLMSAADKKKLDGFGAASTYATTNYVTQQIAASTHLKKSIVSALPSIANAEDNTIYMVPRTVASGEAADGYDEYLLVNGKFELIGHTATTIETLSDAEIDAILGG